MNIKTGVAVCFVILLSAFLIKTTHTPVKEVQTVNEFKELCAQNTPLVMFFYAPTCGACNRMKETFQTVAQKISHAQLLKVNVHNKNLKSLVDAFNISAVPTIITRQVGLLDATQFTKLVQGLKK